MAFAFISIRTPKYHIRPMPIWTLIDTGSPWTSITPYDAMMLKIPLSVLKPNRKYPYVLFASHKFERLSLTHITLRLKNDAGEIVSFDLPSISVLKPTKKISLDVFKGIPSVLGIDFININKFQLYFDPSQEESYLLNEEI